MIDSQLITKLLITAFALTAMPALAQDEKTGPSPDTASAARQSAPAGNEKPHGFFRSIGRTFAHPVKLFHFPHRNSNKAEQKFGNDMPQQALTRSKPGNQVQQLNAAANQSSADMAQQRQGRLKATKMPKAGQAYNKSTKPTKPRKTKMPKMPSLHRASRPKLPTIRPAKN
jgi:hypothetical protein